MIVGWAEVAWGQDPPAAVEEVARWPERYPGQVQPSDPHFDLELMYADHRFDEGVALARQRLAANPDDINLYWHIVRFMYEQGERFQRDDPNVDKLAHYERMVEVVEAGLKRAPTDPHLLFALGLAKGRLGTTRGVLSSLFMAKEIEQSWLTSSTSGLTYSSVNGSEQLPCDTYLALSIYYRLVPEYWLVQVIAGTRGDRQKAVDYAIKADRCAPDRIRVLMELGASQLCKGADSDDAAMVERGLQALRRVGGIAPVIPTDFIDHQHAKLLIAEPELACEYSRDGQQDLDASKLEGAR